MARIIPILMVVNLFVPAVFNLRCLYEADQSCAIMSIAHLLCELIMFLYTIGKKAPSLMTFMRLFHVTWLILLPIALLNIPLLSQAAGILFFVRGFAIKGLEHIFSLLCWSGNQMIIPVFLWSLVPVLIIAYIGRNRPDTPDPET